MLKIFKIQKEVADGDKIREKNLYISLFNSNGGVLWRIFYSANNNVVLFQFDTLDIDGLGVYRT